MRSTGGVLDTSCSDLRGVFRCHFGLFRVRWSCPLDVFSIECSIDKLTSK